MDKDSVKTVGELAEYPVFKWFKEIASVPHPSGHTEKIGAYLVDFARERGLKYHTDGNHNVVIFKDGSKGREAEEPVILQGHTDMVADKCPGSTHNFLTDPLKLMVEGDWLTADGTTLGGDDGAAVAIMLAILDDTSLEHPPLECVFTTDEEDGLIGASALDMSVLKGRRLVNLDSEDEGILTAGCAGGMTVKVDLPVERIYQSGALVTLTVGDLRGGHSGQMINAGRGNADKLMAETIKELSIRAGGCGLVTFEGGQRDNVIPFRAEASAVIGGGVILDADAFGREMTEHFRERFGDKDPDILISAEVSPAVDMMAVTPDSTERILALMERLPYGVIRMSEALPGLVQTSANIGVVRLEKDVFRAVLSVRSSVVSERDAVGDKIDRTADELGASVRRQGVYPAWEFRAESPLRDRMCALWKTMTGKDMKVDVIHAGLECGLFYESLEGLDAVSIGPDMQDIHTYKERLSIPSTLRLYDYVLELLKEL